MRFLKMKKAAALLLLLVFFLLSACQNVSRPNKTIVVLTQETAETAAPAEAESEAVIEETPSVEASTETDASEAEKQDYVLNHNSHKFHDPGCSSVPQIKEKNREDVTASRQELLASGFTPCGNCKP